MLRCLLRLRNAVNNINRTVWNQNQSVILVEHLVQCVTTAHVWCSLVEVSHAVIMLAATDGFHVQKLIQSGVTNLCSNEQLAEEIASSLSSFVGTVALLSSLS